MAVDGRGEDGLGEVLRPRYVEVAAKDGVYESLYFTAHHSTEPRALWVRHTVLKPPGKSPRASLWCTWFADGGVRAAKVTTSDVLSPPGRRLQVGEHGWIGSAGAAGGVDQPGLRARWELTFHRPEPPMFHLPHRWMYSAPLPRTKSLSAAPMLTLAGSLEVDGQPVGVDGWPCSIGHNWGAEHAERWIWIHADAAADAGGAGGPTTDGPVWLDIVVGRIRIGPVTTPWIANGAVSVAGRRHHLGGLRPGAGTAVIEHDTGVTVVVRGSGITVEVRSETDPAGSVAWRYADPVGGTREVVNCSVARATLAIGRRDGGNLVVTAPVSAVEIGARRRRLDVPLQPFPD